MRTTAALGVVGALWCASSLAGAWPLPEREPLPLRLDESPDLPLLAPFRDPKGPPATNAASYRRGPWGEWMHRVWLSPAFPLAVSDKQHWFVAASSATLVRSEPSAGYFLHRGATRLVRSEPSAGYFLHGGATRLVRSEPSAGYFLHGDDRLVPPWLARLPPDYAATLLAELGCRGGLGCSPGVAFPAESFAVLWTALAPLAFPTPEWQCKERPTTIMRMGRESASLVLVACDGAIAGDALARLSILARPPGVAAPPPLPDDPDPAAAPGEWSPGVHLLEPRLLWLVARLADRFRWRGVYLYSGYRPARGSASAAPASAAESHTSLHATGRALDLSVDGVPSEELLAACFDLPDAGCGYYPHHKFVHVDVRPRSTGSAVWVDASQPGAPSRYLDAWPGVVERGRVVWNKR